MSISASNFPTQITVAELVAGVALAHNEPVRQRRRAALTRLQSKPVLLIDAVTGEVYGTLSAALQRAGRGSHRHRAQTCGWPHRLFKTGYVS